MANALTDIQQALETIRIMSGKADWQRKLDILLLMMSTSQSVVANARKLTEPEKTSETNCRYTKNTGCETICEHAKHRHKNGK